MSVIKAKLMSDSSTELVALHNIIKIQGVPQNMRVGELFSMSSSMYWRHFASYFVKKSFILILL